MFLSVFLCTTGALSQTGDTQRPPLHGRHWMAIAGKPLAASAGAQLFARKGNAVDAACAILAASCTMHDSLSWGGETQALIYHPIQKKVIGINALGAAPSGASADFFLRKGMRFPPGEGPLAAVTPGTPGGLLVMLAEFGSMSLEAVLGPSIEMAEGYPMEAETSSWLQASRDTLKKWQYSKDIFLPHLGQPYEAPQPGEIFRQHDLKATLEKLVFAEKRALARGRSRKEAIMAAYHRFYRGDIAEEFVRGSRELGGLITASDLANWQVYLEKPVMSSYHEVEVYKLNTWTQGPAMLQILNMLEPLNLRGMGLNTSRYIHTLYQVMNLAFADRDFYYGDPYYPPREPLETLLSKPYAMHRLRQVNPFHNDPLVMPGDPYAFDDSPHPFRKALKQWHRERLTGPEKKTAFHSKKYHQDFRAGTTTIQTADKEGWLVSITPSGAWIPACIAGKTGVGMSQRLQSFVLRPEDGPYNVLEPGKRPRATLTPTIVLKDKEPLLACGVQGGDTQEQNLVQFLVNMLDFGMSVQEACEAPNITSYQMMASFGTHAYEPGKLTLHHDVPPWVRRELEGMGYRLHFDAKTSGPITAIFLDHTHTTLWGGVSNHSEDHGIAW
ncbi:MAG: gamma-glutamyltransferase [Verrucomicrobiota bacterium]|nr:gamma-glutamyltransferase [Verrucomicrobiota bacterium]